MARRTAALAAAELISGGFHLAVVVVMHGGGGVAATDNRLSAPLDCYLRDELETSSHGEQLPISRTGKLGNSLRPFIVELNHFRGGGPLPSHNDSVLVPLFFGNRILC